MKREKVGWSRAALVAAAWMSAALVASAAEPEKAAAPDGKALFLAQKCNMCHAVPAAGIKAQVTSEKMAGPAITGASSRVTPEVLAKFLRKQGELDGKPHPKELKCTDAELKAIIDWMNRQKPATP